MNLYDIVLLKDGRKGIIVELFDDSCDVDIGDSPDTWETITVPRKDIISTEDSPNGD